METVGLSQVGGLTTEILAKLGTQRLAVLTSDKVPGAVVLPHTDSKQAAVNLAKQYMDMVNGYYLPDERITVRDLCGPMIVSRLKGRLQAKLTNCGKLEVLRRGIPVAILLPPPGDKESAERGAMSYLEHLGHLST